MHAYVLTVVKDMQQRNGTLFLGDRGLYFLCAHVGRLADYRFRSDAPFADQLNRWRTDNTPLELTEADLSAAVPTLTGSLEIAVGTIELCQRSMWSGSKIVYGGGHKLGLWSPGFAGRFRDEAKAWAARHGIATKGL